MCLFHRPSIYVNDESLDENAYLAELDNERGSPTPDDHDSSDGKKMPTKSSFGKFFHQKLLRSPSSSTANVQKVNSPETK